MSTTQERCDQLFKELDMKFNFNYESYVGKTLLNEDFNVHTTEVQCDSDEEWDTKINSLKQELQKRKNKTVIETLKRIPELSDDVLVEAFTILFNEWKSDWPDYDKSQEMKAIFSGGTKPCVHFDNWVACISFLYLHLNK